MYDYVGAIYDCPHFRKTHWTLGQYGWFTVWYETFIEFPDPIDICKEIIVLKHLSFSLKRGATQFGKY